MAADLEASLTSGSHLPSHGGTFQGTRSHLQQQNPSEDFIAVGPDIASSAFKPPGRPLVGAGEKGRPLVGTWKDINSLSHTGEGEGNDPKDVAATGKTLAEAEAKMAAGKQPEPGQSTADMTAFQSFLTKIHQLEQQNQNQHSAAYSNALQQSAFIKNLLMKNAAINNRISSPITMGGLSPSGTSPMQHGSRTSSPIIFGSQPPRHLAAPAPIHPGAIAPPLSPRGLAPQLGMMNPGMVGQGLRSPVPLRQPSPQDLRAHAQAILQNAVLKKQFQEQRAEQLKKQLEWAAAISKAEVNQMNSFHNSMNQQPVQATSLSVQDNATSTPTAAKATIDPAFIPTSVIRKSASDNRDKEKPSLNDSNASSGTVQSQKLDMDNEEHGEEKKENEGQKSMGPAQQDGRAVNEQEMRSALERLHLEQQAMTNPQVESALKALLGQAQQQQQARNMIVARGGATGGGGGAPVAAAPLSQGQQQLQHLQQQLQQHQAAQLQHTLQMLYSNNRGVNPGAAVPGAGRPIVKNNSTQVNVNNNLTAAQRVVLETIAAEQQRHQIMAFNPAVGLGQAPPPVQPPSPNTNPFLLQRLLQQQQQQQKSFANAQAGQAQLLAALTAQQQAAAAAARGASHPGHMQTQAAPRPMFSSLGAHGFGAVSSYGAGAPQGRPIQAGVRPGLNFGADQNQQPADLTKLFNSDILKQQAGNLPPLPASQGQQVMTLDEIEGHQPAN